MSWYHVAGHQQDSVVCTCVRLSRNLTGYPFPAHLEAAGAKEIIGKVEGVRERTAFSPRTFPRSPAERQTHWRKSALSGLASPARVSPTPCFSTTPATSP